jgi:hypothetical protein
VLPAVHAAAAAAAEVLVLLLHYCPPAEFFVAAAPLSAVLPPSAYWQFPVGRLLFPVWKAASINMNNRGK